MASVEKHPRFTGPGTVHVTRPTFSGLERTQDLIEEEPENGWAAWSPGNSHWWIDFVEVSERAFWREMIRRSGITGADEA